MVRRAVVNSAAVLITLYACFALTGASARPGHSDFYKSKTIYMLVGVPVGSSVDQLARLVARHIGAHIPGNPTVITQNMAGGGGVVMANYLYNVAPQDGSYMGLMQTTLALSQAVGLQSLRFDASKFGWIGSPTPRSHSIMIVRKGTGVRTIADARRIEVIAGASAKGAHEYTVPAILNEFLGTKIKIIPGYPSISSIFMAMESGELDAAGTSWEEFKAEKPDFIRDKKVVVLVQDGPRAAELPDVPTLQELAKSDDNRRTIALLLSSEAVGRPFAVAPRTPDDRVRILRTAFDDTMKDPSFLSDANTAGVEVDPIRGETIQDVVEQVLRTSKPLVERAKTIIE